MRVATILAAGVCTFLAIATPAVAQAPADTLAVRHAMRQFHDAIARGDSTAALALLAPDAVILEMGGVESREEYRAHHLPADIRFAMAVPSKAGPLHVTLAGDVAWVTSTSVSTGTFEGRAINSVGAELAVLARTAEGWRIRALHWSSRRRSSS